MIFTIREKMRSESYKFYGQEQFKQFRFRMCTNTKNLTEGNNKHIGCSRYFIIPWITSSDNWVLLM